MRRLIAMRVLVGAVVIALLGSCGEDGSSTPALKITAATPPAGTAGQPYAGYTFLATGGAPPISWASYGSLPPGLSFDKSGQLSGMPTTAGTYNFSVTVIDSSIPALTANTPVGVKINDSQIVVAPASPPAGVVSYPYVGFSFSASGGSPPYTWTANGSLPPGITLGSDGTLSGTPTQAGSFSFSVTATDSAQPATSGPPLATNIQISPPVTLTLNPTPAPPDGVEGTPYGPFSFSTTGGYQPLHWSITQGTLPAGITLGSDGSLTGTPTSNGPFMITVTVTDSAVPPVNSSQSFSFNVALPPPPVITYTEPPTGTVGVAYSPLQFAATGGVPPLAWSETPPLTMGLTLSSAGVLSGTPTTAGQFPIMLNVQDALSRGATPLANVVRVSMARPAAAFSLTGSLGIPRSGHAATLLLSGKVLVTGGGHGVPDATAELFDAATASFTPTAGNMTEARQGHTATLLKLSNSTLANYGKVLIVGSTDESAELYDPGSSTFAMTGSMHHARTSPTATLLNTNKVLIVGNTTTGDQTAELYDPASGTFSDTGSTTASRSGHTATLLVSGQVLITGGGSSTAELYDPTHGTFTATTGSMTESRSGHTATLLEGGSEAGQLGDVLIVGTDGSADLYDPNTGMFTRVGSMSTAVALASIAHTASLRPDGTVLVTGGHSTRACRPTTFFAPVSKSGAALFAPESDGFTGTGSLNTPRDLHTATVLEDGSVLIVGGNDHSLSFVFYRCTPKATVLSSAELFK